MKIGSAQILIIAFSTLITLFSTIISIAGVVMDYDGDGRTDLVVTRRIDHQMIWYVRGSSGSERIIPWGAYTFIGEPERYSDAPVSEDFDGDGKWDITVWRSYLDSPESKGYFYVFLSATSTVRVIQWGIRQDIPNPQDYDGDGVADFTVTRIDSTGMTWFINQSRDGVRLERFGIGGDIPLRGDFDGDGKADLAICRPNPFTQFTDYTFFIKRSSDGGWMVELFGNEHRDFPAPGDYDGDGKTDIAVWRGRSEFGNGTWYWHRSSDGQYEQVQWGSVNTPDFPVQGDYDGDGKTDPAVWRQYGIGQQAYFFILQSRDGIRYEPWGLSTDGTGRLW